MKIQPKKMTNKEFVDQIIEIAKVRIQELSVFETVSMEQINKIIDCRTKFNQKCAKENLELNKRILMYFGEYGRVH